jgi:hypothetical protein
MSASVASSDDRFVANIPSMWPANLPRTHHLAVFFAGIRTLLPIGNIAPQSHPNARPELSPMVVRAFDSARVRHGLAVREPRCVHA